MEVTARGSRSAEYLHDQRNFLDCDFLSLDKAILHESFDFSSEWLRDVADLVIRVQEVAQFIRREFSEHIRKTGQQHLEQSFRATHTEHKASRDLLKTRVVELTEVSHDRVLHALAEEWRTIA